MPAVAIPLIRIVIVFIVNALCFHSSWMQIWFVLMELLLLLTLSSSALFKW
jgi:hypothetical protein